MMTIMLVSLQSTFRIYMCKAHTGAAILSNQKTKKSEEKTVWIHGIQKQQKKTWGKCCLFSDGTDNRVRPLTDSHDSWFGDADIAEQCCSATHSLAMKHNSQQRHLMMAHRFLQ